MANLEVLQKKIAHRLEALRQGADPTPYRVRGCDALLDGLARRGATCYLASGTDELFVVEEARLLGLDAYFGQRIYGARDDYQSFSKKMLLERLRTDHGLRGTELAAFGDGYVEIESAREVGGLAIGVASRENGELGWDAWKKERLIATGAQVLVPDWQESELLLSFLCGETHA